ncbi:hypothetical protein [Ruminococcus sp. HUN007]|uniref:hypothetical protein n=1 Tax=Ruminococcus sp. HUN007 TaxID=1514668 RepID=UPI000AACBA64|nr:hypothetical protein [Ruminococcus sp. HUN007]
MNIFQQSFRELSGYGDVERCLRDSVSPVCVTGLAQIHKAQLLLTVSEQHTALVITDDDNTARRLAEDINEMASEEIAVCFPSREYTIHSAEGVSHEYEHARLGVLSKILEGRCRIVAAGAEAVMQYVPPSEALRENSFVIKKGSEFDTSDLAKRLVRCGYTKCESIEGPSQFSIRGSIVDIYSPQAPAPYRIEFWGDEVDSINYFDPESQRRTDSVEEVMIIPSRELIYEPSALADLIEKTAGQSRAANAGKFREKAAADIEKLRQGIFIENSDKYINLIFPEYSSVFRLLQRRRVLQRIQPDNEPCKGNRGTVHRRRPHNA